MAFRASAVLRVAGGPVPVNQKYTVQSVGVWESIRRALAVSPNRSNGVPLNAQYRNPPPGSNDPLGYTDPVTLPAADIAGNPYWVRDTRRSYPQLSTVTQADAVALLAVGSRAAPDDAALGLGAAGEEKLGLVRQEGREKGLAGYFAEHKGAAGKKVLGADGLPPSPSGMRVGVASGEKAYEMNSEEEQSYPEEYPCRTFV